MATSTRISAREKILAAASNLFYEKGYQGTTIDDVVNGSGVSRPTLYTQFSTKEDLGIAYLQLRRQQDLTDMREVIRQQKTPEDRYLAVISLVGKTLISTNFGGCRFFNVIAELHTPSNPLVKEAKHYIESFREILRDVVVELKASSKQHKNLDVNRVTDVYYLLVAGAIMASQECQELWPIDRATQEIKRLIGK